MKNLDPKNYILSLTEVNYLKPIPQEELDATRVELIKEMFNYHSLTGKRYQRFVVKFIEYTAGTFNLQNPKVAFAKLSKNVCGKHTYCDDIIELDKFLFSRPSYPEKFFDFLNTIMHEFAHSKEVNQGVFSYKKFSNENDAPIRYDLSQNLTALSFYLNQRQKRLMDHFGLSFYYLSSWEMFARKNAIDEMEKFLQDAKKLLNNKIIPPTKENIDLFNHFSFQQYNITEDEKYYQKSSKMYTSKNNNAYKSTKTSVQELLDCLYNTGGYPNIDIVSNILLLFLDPTLTTQAQLNKFNNYLHKQAIATEDDETATVLLEYSLSLAVLKPTKNSKKIFEDAYKLCYALEQKKFPDLMNKLQYEVVDFLLEQPYFAIEKSYVDKEYQKYHTKQEFARYFRLQKLKEKKDEEINKNNLEEMQK